MIHIKKIFKDRSEKINQMLMQVIFYGSMTSLLFNVLKITPNLATDEPSELSYVLKGYNPFLVGAIGAFTITFIVKGIEFYYAILLRGQTVPRKRFAASSCLLGTIPISYRVDQIVLKDEMVLLVLQFIFCILGFVIGVRWYLVGAVGMCLYLILFLTLSFEEMKAFLNSSKKRRVLILAAFALAFILCAGYWVIQERVANYQGQFSGMIMNEEQSIIAACDIENQSVQEVGTIAPLEYEGDVSIDSKGKIFAYTKWNETLTNQFVVVRGKNVGKDQVFGKETTSRKLSTHHPILFSKGTNLLCIETEEIDSFPKERLVIYDISAGTKTVVDETEIKTIEATDENSESGYLVRQEEYDAFLKKYGAPPILLEKELASIIFMKYSGPVIDQKDHRILYAKTLYRNLGSNSKGIPVIASSTIWSYDLETEDTKPIYGSEDNKLIGKLDISPDFCKIIFSESSSPNGEESQIVELELTDDAAAKSTILYHSSGQHYVNIDPVYLSQNCISFLTIAKGEPLEKATRFIGDTTDHEYREIEIWFHEKKELLKLFQRIYS